MSKHRFMPSKGIPKDMISTRTLLTDSRKTTYRRMKNTYGAGKHLRAEVKPCQTHKDPSGRLAEAAAAEVRRGLSPLSSSSEVHVCVSNYCWNLLQALAGAAAERWTACGIKAGVVRKKERWKERQNRWKRRKERGQTGGCELSAN